MSILDKAKELKMKMEAELNNVISNSEFNNEATRKLTIVTRNLTELTHYERRYQFGDQQEEIAYFKDHKPEFLSFYFYYTQLIKWATVSAFREAEEVVMYYKEQLRELETEYVKNADTYHYFLSGESHLDHDYFLNGGINIRFITSKECYSGYEVCKGKMLALHRLRHYLSDSINNSKPSRFHFDLQWNASRTELIELLYALYASGAFGKTTLKKIVYAFGELFQLDLKHFAQYIVNIKLRKETSQTFFLNTLSQAMQERLDKED